MAFLTWIVPVVAPLAILRYVVPSRMEAGTGGPAAWVARLGDQHPLGVAVLLFLVFAVVAGYWQRWFRQRDRHRPAVESRRVGRRSLAVGLPPALLAVVGLGAVAVIARTSVVEIYRVASLSMVPTLNAGDRLLVNKTAYGIRLPFNRRWAARSPRRGDIIVVADPSARSRGVGPKSLVKRVIGLPGDLVAFRDGSAFVNGKIVPACDAGPFVTAVGTSTVRGRLAVEYLDGQAYLTIRTPLDESVFAGYRVPPGEVFVLGDNRGMSSDSRAWNDGRGGSLRIDEIEGRVSRLAVGTLPDGRVNLGELLPPLRPMLRASSVDLRHVQQQIGRCLAAPPPPF